MFHWGFFFYYYANTYTVYVVISNYENYFELLYSQLYLTAFKSSVFNSKFAKKEIRTKIHIIDINLLCFVGT